MRQFCLLCSPTRAQSQDQASIINMPASALSQFPSLSCRVEDIIGVSAGAPAVVPAAAVAPQELSSSEDRAVLLPIFQLIIHC